MKVIKIVILTLLISFLLFVATVYITFKYILTPERIKNYVNNYIEQTVNEQLEKGKTAILDKIYLSRFKGNNNITETDNLDNSDKKPEDMKLSDKFIDVNLLTEEIVNMGILDKISDVNLLASQFFSDANIKIGELKYKVTEYFNNRNRQESEE